MCFRKDGIMNRLKKTEMMAQTYMQYGNSAGEGRAIEIDNYKEEMVNIFEKKLTSLASRGAPLEYLDDCRTIIDIVNNSQDFRRAVDKINSETNWRIIYTIRR